MIGRTRRAVLGGAVLAAAAGLGAVLLLRQPPPPSEEQGRAWLAGFADRLTSAGTWGAQGSAALALFPGLGPWPGDGCVLAWSRREPSAPVVTYQRLELGRLSAAEPCDQAQFGILSTTLRQSEGITPGALATLFNERLGPPDIHRDTGLRGTVTTTWQAQDGIFATMEERVQPGGADAFSLLFVRSYASPTTLGSPAEAERWMERTVELMTGPDLPNARGAAAAALVDADMRPEGLDAENCPTMFQVNLLAKGPFGSGQSLLLDRPDGTPCGEAKFSWLSMRIWRRDPVTAAAMVARLQAKLGAPALSRDFEWNVVRYRWSTAHGTVVELTEYLSATERYWMSLRSWRT